MLRCVLRISRELSLEPALPCVVGWAVKQGEQGEVEECCPVEGGEKGLEDGPDVVCGLELGLLWGESVLEDYMMRGGRTFVRMIVMPWARMLERPLRKKDWIEALTIGESIIVVKLE